MKIIRPARPAEPAITPPVSPGCNTVQHSLCTGDHGFLLPAGEGQDEGKKRCSLLNPLTLALSRREREFGITLFLTSNFVPNTVTPGGAWEQEETVES